MINYKTLIFDSINYPCVKEIKDITLIDISTTLAKDLIASHYLN